MACVTSVTLRCSARVSSLVLIALLSLGALLAARVCMCDEVTLNNEFQDIEGELDVIVAGNETLYFVRHESGSVTPVTLDDDDDSREDALMIKYAGHLVRLRKQRDDRYEENDEQQQEGPAMVTLSRRPQHTQLQEQWQGSVSSNGRPPIRARILQSMGPAAETASPTAVKNVFIGSQNITSVVYLLSFCGMPAAQSGEAFRAMWLNGPNTPPKARTMQNNLAHCSQGAAKFSNETQHIFHVPLPCEGTFNGRPYKLTKQCAYNDWYNWMNLAEDYVQNTLGKDISSIRQRIAVLPVGLDGEPGQLCSWASGWATSGCDGSRCFAWIHADKSGETWPYMHEMGHTWGMDHAGRLGSSDDYADNTCIMGSGYSTTCYNAPNTWRLGWVSPLPGAELSTPSLEVGRPKTFFLPSQNKARQSIIRINPNWTITGREYYDNTMTIVPVYYISLRSSEWPFEQFALGPFVAVYTSRARQRVDSFQITTRQSELMRSNGSVYRSTMPVGLVITVNWIASDGDNASVTVCRTAGMSESLGGDSCSDGRDNDCDGLVDRDDPDCAGVDTTTALNARAAPSPLSSPFKRSPSPPSPLPSLPSPWPSPPLRQFPPSPSTPLPPSPTPPPPRPSSPRPPTQRPKSPPPLKKPPRAPKPPRTPHIPRPPPRPRRARP